ncbi:MAG: YihY/virulence factor BrkB family protein [Candidatus Latescibacterota bacterium]
MDKVEKVVWKHLIFWSRVLRSTVRSAYKHDCTDAAAAMAFDFVFAVFPAILVLSALIGIFDISTEDFLHLLEDLGVVLPSAFIKTVEDNLNHIADSSQSLFVVGILGVIWPASASMSTTMTALNRAFSTDERRSFWQRRILSIFLVVAFGLSLIFLFNLIVFSEQVESWVRTHSPLFQDFPSLAAFLRRTAGIVGAVLAAACIYRLVPSRRLGWLDVLPGSLLFFFLWTFIVTGFRYYVRSFSYYNLVYGGLGVVIIILLSAYLVAFTLLLGGELNAALQRLRPKEKA